MSLKNTKSDGQEQCNMEYMIGKFYELGLVVLAGLGVYLFTTWLWNVTRVK